MTASRFKLQLRALIILAGAAVVGIVGIAFACTDATNYPVWRLAAPAMDGVGRPVLTPGNDTRINLLWLMRSLHPVGDGNAVQPKPDYDTEQFGKTFLSWPSLRATYWPHPQQNDVNSTETCVPPVAATGAFAAAVAQDSEVPLAERTALMALRQKVGCGTVDWTAAIASAHGCEFLAYLQASSAFYDNKWPAAREKFADLSHAYAPWVADTAAYMPIRIALRQAVAGAFDKYGNFGGIEQVDGNAVAAAKTAIAAYLQAWPHGRYAASAQALTRRVLWLQGDTARLAPVYEQLLAATPPDSEAAADLVEEVDNDLLSNDKADAALRRAGDMPLLTAISDLRQMRNEPDDRPVNPMPLAAGALAAQKPVFARWGDLYGFLLATRAFYAGDAPAGILAAIPESDPSATPLAFSRQVLRGMALARAGDADEERYWARLIAGAHPLYQRAFVELGLAVHWQGADRLDLIFAPGSLVEDQMTREIVLQTIAPPAILRGAAADTTRGDHERDVARFILLYKDLSRQAYGDFGRDLTLVPAGAAVGTPSRSDSDDPIVPGLFTTGKWSDGFACPALAETAATLAKMPTDRSARLCLGDFWRLNRFDDFALLDTSETNVGKVGAGPETLGNVPDHFPGTPLRRDAIYGAVLADAHATREQRAYALYRAVLCYAPAGYNECAGPPQSAEDMDKAAVRKPQRQAWYLELKQHYPDSRWAKALRYYW